MDYKIQIAPNKVRQVLLLAVILLLGILVYTQMTFLLGGFLGSVALYMIMRKLMYKMVYQKHWKKWVSAMLLMLVSFIIIILPFAWIASLFVQKITPILKDPTIITATADKIEQYINRRFGVDILSQTNIQKITSTISTIVPKVLTSTLNVVANIVVMYFILWFMLTNSSKVELWLQRNLPFKPENRQKVLMEIKESVMSNTIGLPIMGIIQGGLAVLGYWIFGAQDPVLWGIVTGICSFIPFVGTMATWVPIAILTFANGDAANGIGLTAWGLIVIGCADNVFRMVLQKKIGDIHPMITVFGVIVGLNMFGFLGLIFGPLMISMFLLLGKIYINEFVNPAEKVETITDTSGGEDKKEEHPPHVHL